MWRCPTAVKQIQVRENFKYVTLNVVLNKFPHKKIIKVINIRTLCINTARVRQGKEVSGLTVMSN